MSKKSIILIVLLVILCAAVAFRLAAPTASSGATEPGTNQIMPREPEDSSLPTDGVPAQPGEGPAGLPTPTV